MPKLHEILAVEEDKKGLANKILAETMNTFIKKQDHFQAEIIKVSSFNEDTEDIIEKDTAMVTTVKDKLNYTAKKISDYIDIVFQKESANATAIADVIIEDQEFFKNMPVTSLLALQKQLKDFRNVVHTIPTLEPAIKWEDAKDQGNDIRKYSSFKIRTKKHTNFKTVASATDRHPAQVEKIVEDIPDAKVTTTKFTSKMTSLEKSEILDRIDIFIEAVKKAKMRANLADVNTTKISKKIFDYILFDKK